MKLFFNKKKFLKRIVKIKKPFSDYFFSSGWARTCAMGKRLKPLKTIVLRCLPDSYKSGRCCFSILGLKNCGKTYTIFFHFTFPWYLPMKKYYIRKILRIYLKNILIRRKEKLFSEWTMPIYGSIDRSMPSISLTA